MGSRYLQRVATLGGLHQKVMMGAVALAAVSMSARADTIELTDGQKLSGSMSRQGDVVVIKTDDGGVVRTKPENVARVTLTSGTSAGETSKAEWLRLAGEIKNANDLATVIGLHDRFLDKYPDSPQSNDVRASQDVYRKLADAHAVKFRGKWVPAAQVEVLAKGWKDQAAPAMALYSSGKWKEALEAARKVIAADNQNGDACTLAGLSAYHLRQLPAARGYFEKLAVLDADDVLAENNLAVIAFEEKQIPQSMIHYGKALQIDPADDQLLDNVTEAIHTYTTTGGDQKAGFFRDLTRLYGSAESSHEEVMRASGLTRKGVFWLTEEQLAGFLKYLSAVKYQMAVLEKRYQVFREAMTANEKELAQVSRRCDELSSTLSSLDAQIAAISDSSGQQGRGGRLGGVAPALLPQSMQYAAQRSQASAAFDRARARQAVLQEEQRKLLADAPDFPAEVAKLNAALASTENLYTNSQSIMELDETVPLVPEKAPNVAAAEAAKLRAPGITPESAPPVARVESAVASAFKAPEETAVAEDDDGPVAIRTPELTYVPVPLPVIDSGYSPPPPVVVQTESGPREPRPSPRPSGRRHSNPPQTLFISLGEFESLTPLEFKHDAVARTGIPMNKGVPGSSALPISSSVTDMVPTGSMPNTAVTPRAAPLPSASGAAPWGTDGSGRPIANPFAGNRNTPLPPAPSSAPPWAPGSSPPAPAKGAK